jgi:hypothetical protein
MDSIFSEDVHVISIDKKFETIQLCVSSLEDKLLEALELEASNLLSLGAKLIFSTSSQFQYMFTWNEQMWGIRNSFYGGH